MVLFIDENPHVAYNANGIIHFNLAVFSSLNHTTEQAHSYMFWFMVFAHQLAHNVVVDHTPQHDALAHSLVHHNFEAMFEILQGNS